MNFTDLLYNLVPIIDTSVLYTLTFKTIDLMLCSFKIK